MACDEPRLPSNRYRRRAPLVHGGLLAHRMEKAASPGTRIEQALRASDSRIRNQD